MDLKSLENNRLYILKRLGILKFLSIIEALLVGFLAFVFIRDALIAVILAVFVGVFFFRFTAKKLKLAQKELQINALNLFLRRFGAKFKKQSLSQKDFLKLGLTKDLKEFKSQNCFEFKDFKIYDIQFLDENKRFFAEFCSKFQKQTKILALKTKNKFISNLQIKISL